MRRSEVQYRERGEGDEYLWKRFIGVAGDEK